MASRCKSRSAWGSSWACPEPTGKRSHRRKEPLRKKEEATRPEPEEEPTEPTELSIKALMMQAVIMLYHEQALPTGHSIQWMMRHLTGCDASLVEIKKAAENSTGLSLEYGPGSRRFTVYMLDEPCKFKGFVEHSDKPLPPHLAQKAERLLEAGGWPTDGPRNAQYLDLALWLREQSSHQTPAGLMKLSLGRLISVIRQRLLGNPPVLGKRGGMLVRWRDSDEYLRQQNCARCRPTGVRAGERFISSWDCLLESLKHVLTLQPNQEILTSNLKPAFREVFDAELSETALGYDSLTGLLQEAVKRSTILDMSGEEQGQWIIRLSLSNAVCDIEELKQQMEVLEEEPERAAAENETPNTPSSTSSAWRDTDSDWRHQDVGPLPSMTPPVPQPLVPMPMPDGSFVPPPAAVDFGLQGARKVLQLAALLPLQQPPSPGGRCPLSTPPPRPEKVTARGRPAASSRPRSECFKDVPTPIKLLTCLDAAADEKGGAVSNQATPTKATQSCSIAAESPKEGAGREGLRLKIVETAEWPHLLPKPPGSPLPWLTRQNRSEPSELRKEAWADAPGNCSTGHAAAAAASFRWQQSLSDSSPSTSTPEKSPTLRYLVRRTFIDAAIIEVETQKPSRLLHVRASSVPKNSP